MSASSIRILAADYVLSALLKRIQGWHCRVGDAELAPPSWQHSNHAESLNSARMTAIDTESNE